MALRECSQISIPAAALNDAWGFLRRAGAQQCEGLALWVGTIDGPIARVTQTYVPAQECLKSASGVGVYVSGSELHKLNVWLFSNRLRILAQIHSHPTDAYHSDTDDDFAIATEVGAFSIVVPHFAAGPIDLATCAVYRLVANGWTEVGRRDVFELLVVER